MSTFTRSQIRIVMSMLSLCPQQPQWMKIVHQRTIFIFYLQSLCPPNIYSPLFNHYFCHLYQYFYLFIIQCAKCKVFFFLDVVSTFNFIIMVPATYLLFPATSDNGYDVCMHAYSAWLAKLRSKQLWAEISFMFDM